MSEIHTIPIVLLGLGGVGRALIEQVLARRAYHARRYGIRLEVRAVCDSTGAAVNPDGLTDEELRRAVEHKAAGGRLADLPFGYYQNNVRHIVDLEVDGRTIVVDVTASDATYEALLLARERGASLVLANKLPITRPFEEARPLLTYPRLRYETTVGAAVPVITTAKRLTASGERIDRVLGALSGTLGYLLTAVEEGMAFSKAVLQAKQMGYTEPDPREDLSGRDVARKALILARTMGWEVELEDVEVESLFPDAWADWPLEDFLSELSALDDDFYAWRDTAQARHEALRYVADIQRGKVKVGLQFVPRSSPLGRLQGPDNMVAFYTEYYPDQPLVLQGRGAGVHATAAGLLSDILELALFPLVP